VVTGGTILGAASAPVISVIGGNVNVSWWGSLFQGNTNALISVTGGHTGSLTFDGFIDATAGTGLQFDNADGTYAFATNSNHVILNGGDAGRDVKRQRRICLHRATELEPMRDPVPDRDRRCGRRLHGAVHHQPMTLIVVRTTPVFRKIEGIDRRAEEELADVVPRSR
jgi:hypothetical protein